LAMSHTSRCILWEPTVTQPNSLQVIVLGDLFFELSSLCG
jgi:hypothetical protein